jgi:thiazole synthase ThiGH ThiG subunit
MAPELFETNRIKLEVLGDEVNLQPDPFALVEAATEIIRLGFHVLPNFTEEWVLCRRLMEVGSAKFSCPGLPQSVLDSDREIPLPCENFLDVFRIFC